MRATKQDLIALLFGFVSAAFLMFSGIVIIFPHTPFIVKQTTIQGVGVGNLTKQEALQKIQSEITLPEQGSIVFTLDLSSFPGLPSDHVASTSLTVNLTEQDTLKLLSITVPVSSLSATYNYEQAATQAWEIGRNGSAVKRISEVVFPKPQTHTIPLKLQWDAQVVQNLVQSIAELVDITPATPTASLRFSNNINSLVVDEGKPGIAVLQEQLTQQVISFSSLPENIIEIPVEITPNLSPDGKIAVLQRAQNVIGKNLEFSAEEKIFSINDKEIVDFFTLPQGFNQEKIQNNIQAWKKSC